MNFLEHCLSLCDYMQALTGVHTTLLNIPSSQFMVPVFSKECFLKTTKCEAYNTHFYGACEAERWDGKYIYYCPQGYTCVAAAPTSREAPMEYCLIAGPMIMTNDDEPFEDPIGEQGTTEEVPRMKTKQVRALSEVLSMAVNACMMETLPPDVDSGRQAELLQMMYDLITDPHPKIYPIESERQLQEYIRSGNKAAAQHVLNELLAYIFNQTENDAVRMKSRTNELLILMGRAAIDGGADVDEILNLCQQYTNEVESLKGIEALNRWIGAILNKFISFVFDFNDIKHQNVVFKATAYIKANLADKITLDKVAEKVYLSKSYFCRIIKEELNCTFTEYVNRLRIDRSKYLLRNTDVSIAEIASAVGFGDQSYFTRIFKRQTGISPGKYREQGWKVSRTETEHGKGSGGTRTKR